MNSQEKIHNNLRCFFVRVADERKHRPLAQKKFQRHFPSELSKKTYLFVFEIFCDKFVCKAKLVFLRVHTKIHETTTP